MHIANKYVARIKREARGSRASFRKHTAGGLLAEHLKFGGQSLLIWLLKILPNSFKCGSITPVCKGGGKDPLEKNMQLQRYHCCPCSSEGS